MKSPDATPAQKKQVLLQIKETGEAITKTIKEQKQVHRGRGKS